MTDFNAELRRAAGRQTPQELAQAAIAAAERAGDASTLRVRVAEAAGLPPELADRLQGDDAAALAEDAKQLASALGELKPAEPLSMDDRLRRAAGREPAPSEEAEAPPVAANFDGGARASAPPPPPSMDSTLRATIADRRERVENYARDLDHERRND